MTRTIRTAAELDALPVGSVVLDHTTVAWQKVSTTAGPRWADATGGPGRISGSLLGRKGGPLTVLHNPSSPAAQPVVPDAAVEAGARALRIAECDDTVPEGFAARMWDEGTTDREKPLRLARAALTAALPLLTAAPSATRDDALREALDAYRAEMERARRSTRTGTSWRAAAGAALADAVEAAIAPAADR